MTCGVLLISNSYINVHTTHMLFTSICWYHTTNPRPSVDVSAIRSGFEANNYMVSMASQMWTHRYIYIIDNCCVLYNSWVIQSKHTSTWKCCIDSRFEWHSQVAQQADRSTESINRQNLVSNGHHASSATRLRSMRSRMTLSATVLRSMRKVPPKSGSMFVKKSCTSVLILVVSYHVLTYCFWSAPINSGSLLAYSHCFCWVGTPISCNISNVQSFGVHRFRLYTGARPNNGKEHMVCSIPLT